MTQGIPCSHSLTNVSKDRQVRCQVDTTNHFTDVFSAGHKIRYPKLSLVSDGRDHWIPLELLIVQYAHAVRCKRITIDLKGVVQDILSKPYVPMLRDAGNDFIARINVLSAITVRFPIPNRDHH